MSSDSTGVFQGLMPTGIVGIEPLLELALDIRWSWNHAADGVWMQLDPELWELTHSPWTVLQLSRKTTSKGCWGIRHFGGQIDELLERAKVAEHAAAWFQRHHQGSALGSIAYFSMEFMLCEGLPIYSGGLGNVAGDQLKAAGDLGVPVTGVGFCIRRVTFVRSSTRRRPAGGISVQRSGSAADHASAAPEWRMAAFQLDLPGHAVWLRAWQVRVGRLKLYLLDSNDAANYPANRGITSELYGGGPETRLLQELVLGIGGWRLLDLLGMAPEVCHLNEGHAAFAGLERARTYMQKTGQPFDVALAVTRAGNLFTTHTAVPAGFDRFDPELILHYLGDYAESSLGLSKPDLLALGRVTGDAAEPFSMSNLAMRVSGGVNGVSRLHGQVSRHLFAPLFPRLPLAEIPVGHVTNGVHVASWDSAQADLLWTENCGKECWLREDDEVSRGIDNVSDAELWRFRNAGRAKLVDWSRARLGRDLAASGASREEIEDAGRILDPRVLTLGFARRFAAYKRPNLLLHDPQRLMRLLNDPIGRFSSSLPGRLIRRIRPARR